MPSPVKTDRCAGRGWITAAPTSAAKLPCPDCGGHDDPGWFTMPLKSTHHGSVWNEPDYAHGDGYDWIEYRERRGWSGMPSWGVDGWNLGDWPLVVFAARRLSAPDAAGIVVVEYCEGDLTTMTYASSGPDAFEAAQALAYHDLDDIAVGWWRRHPSTAPDGLPMLEGVQIPDRFLGPPNGTVRARLGYGS